MHPQRERTLHNLYVLPNNGAQVRTYLLFTPCTYIECGFAPLLPDMCGIGFLFSLNIVPTLTTVICRCLSNLGSVIQFSFPTSYYCCLVGNVQSDLLRFLLL